MIKLKGAGYTSDFITCKKCGVLSIAVCEVGNSTKAVLNIKSMLEHDFSSDPVQTNFDNEGVEGRLERRNKNWTGKVVFKSF